MEENSFDNFLIRQISIFPKLQRDILSLTLGLGDSFDNFLVKETSKSPYLRRDILSLLLGLGDPFESVHTSEEIAGKLNKSKETIDKNLVIAMQKLSDICKEKNKDKKKTPISRGLFSVLLNEVFPCFHCFSKTSPTHTYKVLHIFLFCERG